MYKYLAVLAFLIALPFITNAQATKIGIVDFQTVIMQMPEIQSADQMLKDVGNKYQDSVIKLRKDLQEKIQQYQKQKAMMAQDAQQKTEEQLQGQQEMMIRYQQEEEQKIQKMRQELLEPLKAKAQKAIQEVAKAEKLSIVIDKSPSNPTVLYSDDKLDITFTVIDRIKRGGDNK
jgi:outer membrane protein